MTQLAFPTARASDPHTSHAAARGVRPGNTDLIDYIHRAVQARPLSHEQIVRYVRSYWQDRWQTSTIVTACARAGLRAVGTTTNSRGRTVQTWMDTAFNSGADGAAENACTSPEDRQPASMHRPSQNVASADRNGL